MIRRLRVRHRVVTTALALGLPVGLWLGLSSRAPIPAMDALPSPLAFDLPPGDAFEVTLAGVRFLRDGSGLTSAVTGPPYQRDDPRFGADVLVYWSLAPVSVPGDLADAVLLGRFEGDVPQRFSPPEWTGYLAFYSLPKRAVLASVPLAEATR